MGYWRRKIMKEDVKTARCMTTGSFIMVNGLKCAMLSTRPFPDTEVVVLPVGVLSGP